MKNYVVILLGFLLVASMPGCSKDDTSYPKAESFINPGVSGTKIQAASKLLRNSMLNS